MGLGLQSGGEASVRAGSHPPSHPKFAWLLCNRYGIIQVINLSQMSFGSWCFSKIWPIFSKLLKLYSCCSAPQPFNVCGAYSGVTSFILGIDDSSSFSFPWSVWLEIHHFYSTHLCLFKFSNPMASLLYSNDLIALHCLPLQESHFCHTPSPLFQFSFLLSVAVHFHLSMSYTFHVKISPSTGQSPFLSWYPHSWKDLYFQLSPVHLMLLFLLSANEPWQQLPETLNYH